jgi:DNA-binding response OmpR family regulator
MNILLAEDEKSVALAVTFALKRDGHKVEVATDGEQALAKLAADDPEAIDLLITDNNMPRMSGLELVRRLRETSFRGKILVLSAHLTPQNCEAYESLGVDSMMPKPFDLHALRKTVDSLAESFT